MTSYHNFNVNLLMRSIYFAVTVGLLLSVFFAFPCEGAKRRSQRNLRQGKEGRWKEGDVRLIRGRAHSAGTVLLYHKGRWGTVCDDKWNVTDSDVVCRQMGFSGSLRTPLKMEFAVRGRRRMWITRVQCQGDEKRLLDCDYVGWGRRVRHMCPGRWRAVGVVCHPKARDPAHRRGRRKLRNRHDRRLAKRAQARKAAMAARRRKALKMKTTIKTTPLIHTTENPFDVETRTYSYNINTVAASQRRRYASLSENTTKAPANIPLALKGRGSQQNTTKTSVSRNNSNDSQLPLKPIAMYTHLADVLSEQAKQETNSTTIEDSIEQIKDSARLTDAKVGPSSTEKTSSPLKPTPETVHTIFKSASASTTRSTYSITNTGALPKWSEKKTTTKENAKAMTTATKAKAMTTTTTTTKAKAVKTTTKAKVMTTTTTTASETNLKEETTTHRTTPTQNINRVKPTTTTTSRSKTATDTEKEITTKTKLETTKTPRTIPRVKSTTETTTTAADTSTIKEKPTTTKSKTPSTQKSTTKTEKTVTSTSTPKTTTEQTTTTTTQTAKPKISDTERTITTNLPTTKTRPKIPSVEEETTVASYKTTTWARTTPKATSETTTAVTGTTITTAQESTEDGWQEDDSALSDSSDLPELVLQLTGGRYRWEGRLEVREKGSNPGPWGSVCGSQWSLRESMVACKQMGHGYGKQALKVNYFGGRVRDMIFYSFNCTGRESTLSQCPRQLISADNSCPRSNMVAGVTCATNLPDLVPDTEQLQSSMRLQARPLYYLQCAMEENCLSSSAYHIRENNSNWRSASRRLMRFSTVVHNRGDADFRPNVAKAHWQWHACHIPYVAKAHWQWHACHMHFHSMEVFAHYDIIDDQGTRLAEGSKASFCLEDTVCDRGISRTFDCEGFGEQGLSVNCSDNYNWDIDCQWIDITDIEPGIYTFTFLLEVNPEMLVAEKDFDNNVVQCMLWYSGYEAKLRDCHHESLFDYRR
ncbi:hypothetical protein ACOMHN_043518 [Nucella lapillus]